MYVCMYVTHISRIVNFMMVSFLKRWLNVIKNLFKCNSLKLTFKNNYKLALKYLINKFCINLNACTIYIY